MYKEKHVLYGCSETGVFDVRQKLFVTSQDQSNKRHQSMSFSHFVKAVMFFYSAQLQSENLQGIKVSENYIKIHQVLPAVRSVQIQ